MHAVEDAAMHGLQSVASVGKRPSHDGGERISEIALLERIAQVDVDRDRRRRRGRRNGFGHGLRVTPRLKLRQGRSPVVRAAGVRALGSKRRCDRFTLRNVREHSLNRKILPHGRRAWRVKELHENCATIRAQFGRNAFARSPWREAKADLPGLHAGISTFASLVEPLSELLKFVVKSPLPIERLRQSIMSVESSRRHETCCGGIVECGLELKGGRLPGFGIIPT